MAFSVTPGQVISWDELNALLAQHGSPSGAKSVVGLPNKPLTKDERDELIISGGDPDAARPTTVRYFTEDGSYFDAVIDNPGQQTGDPFAGSGQGSTFRIADYKPSQKFQQSQRQESEPKGPPGGKPYIDEETPGGRRLGWNPETQQYDRDLGASGAPQKEAKPAGPKGDVQTIAGRVKEYNPATGQYDIDHGPSTKPEGPQVVAGTLNTTSPRYATANPDGSLVWTENPNYQKPDPKPVSLPPNQRTITWDNGDGTFRTESNPNYQRPSKIDRDPSTGRLIEITEDDQGNPIVKPVTEQTAVKPSDIPTLQTQYGSIATDLGNYLTDLRGRQARGELTPTEVQSAWQTAHQQASVQVSELNNILDNSRAIWATEVTQRGQTLADTQGRRAFAQSMASNAFQMANTSVARPGRGEAIGRNIGALMTLGQRYAEGLGAFRESPEVAAPTSLQQVRDLPIPGLPVPAGARASGGAVAPGAQRPDLPPLPPPLPAPETPEIAPVPQATGAGAETPRQYTPAQSGPIPLAPGGGGGQQVQVRDAQTGAVQTTDEAMAQELVRAGRGRYQIVGAGVDPISSMGSRMQGGMNLDIDGLTSDMASAGADDPFWQAGVKQAHDDMLAGRLPL